MRQEWDTHFLKYQDESSQNFSVKRSDAVKNSGPRESSLVPSERELPSSYKYKYIHYLCIHGVKHCKKKMKKAKPGSDKKTVPVSFPKSRKRNSRYTGCGAELKIHVPFSENLGKYNGFKILSFKGKHSTIILFIQHCIALTLGKEALRGI
jgi:hypothetical protein